MHTIQFDPQTEQALSQYAALAGKDIEQFIKDLVLEFLEDQEDISDAETVLTNLANGSETTVSLETVKAEYGL
jgi:predicted DNA-binding protein